MSPIAKREYLKTIAPRYQKASRKEKTVILDEFCAICGYTRKYAIRKLRSFKIKRRPVIRGKPGPKSIYDTSEIRKVLEKMWLAANLPCAKRLKAIIPVWIGSYQIEFGFISFEALQKLNKISASTINRVLRPMRIEHRGIGRCTAKPGLILKHHIPIKTNQWDEEKPGFLESDTIAHCGTSMAGLFAFTIDTVDIATGWTEQRAVYGKGERDVLKQIKDIESSMPFPVLGFDCDNGSEFLNWHLIRHFTERKQPVQFTRSRPYHKDDNAHVEQKNWTHVRQWLGYRRFEDPRIVPLLNDLYRTEWRLFHNFFLPSMKLEEKKRVGSRIIKIHDRPKTPYQRILESKHAKEKTKQILKEQFKDLNPFKLRKTIQEKIYRILKLAELP